MLKVYRYLIVSIVTFLILSLLCHFIFSSIILRSGIRYSKMYSGMIDTDVLVIGNSRGVNSMYTPYLKDKYQINAFNLSYNGLSIDMYEPLLEDFLLNNPSPKSVFLEVSMLSRSFNNLKDLKLYMGVSRNLENLLKKELPDIYYASKFIPLFRYNSEFFLRNLYYLGNNDQFWINRYSITEEYYRRYNPGDTSCQLPPLQSLEPIFSVLDLLKDNGIEPIVYISPYLPKKAEERELYNSFIIETIREKYPEVKIYDYSAVIDEYTSFADAIHLNESGACQLLDIMVADGVFENTTK